MSARNVEQEFDSLKADFGKLSADLVALTDALRGLNGRDAKDYLAKLGSIAAGESDGLRAAAAELGARGQDAVASVGRQISDRPVMSVLICFGLGLLIGKLLDR
jgi:ElaB/YqjD/DUF883 family membrane-anchored ribosome-binding protein